MSAGPSWRRVRALTLLVALSGSPAHARGPFAVQDRPAPAPAATLAARPLPAPADAGARHPRWSRGGDGRLLLTWTAPIDPGATADGPLHAVRVAELQEATGAAFAPAVELERGSGHFVNWADAPLVTGLADGALFGAWLAESGSGPYAYGVRVRHAGTQDEPRWLHTDASAVEHGFVSLCPDPEGGVDAIWLDGRAMQAQGGHGHGAGAMALYARRVGADGAFGPERVLDERVCDCCHTAAARLADGTLVVAYRDRGEDERRDVSFVTLAPGADAPSAPRPVHADGWTIDGCPVNGPELVARGDRVACVWYTEAPGPRVLLAISAPGCDGFGKPIRVDDAATLGRPSAAWLADGSLLVAHLVETDRARGRGEWRVRRFVDGAPEGAPLVLAEVDATRKSGFLRLAALAGAEGGGGGEDAVAAWTEVDDGHRLRAALVRVAE